MRWWEGLAPVDAAGPVEAPEHRLVWREGELHLAAHPDPDADRALGALGGERCACVDLLDAWRGSHENGAVLTVAARHDGDLLRAPTETILELRADLRRWRATSGSLVEEARISRDGFAIDRLAALAGPAERAAAARLGFLLLLGLEPRLLHRLQASVAAALAERPDRWPQLTAATAARALPALAALGWRGGRDDVTLGDEPSMTEDAVVLPADWLARVWGRGLAAAVDGHVVTEVTSVTSDGAYEVLAVAPGKGRMALRVAQVGE